MTNLLTLTLFGSPEVRFNGQPVTGFRSSKAQALLYYLAVTGRPHTRPTLAGLFWGDQPEAAARTNLSKCLSNLRELVGDAVLLDRQTVAFNRDYPYHLDTEHFTAGVGQSPTSETIPVLQTALALYRGEQSLSLLRQSGNLHEITMTLGTLAYTAIDMADYSKARAYLDEMLQISEGLGNQNGVATTLCIMGYLAYTQQDFATAQPLYEKSIALCESIGDRLQLPEPIMWLGVLALMRSQYVEARSQLGQALLLYQSGNNLRRMATVVGYLANLEAFQGNALRAVTLNSAGIGLDITVYRTTTEPIPYLPFEMTAFKQAQRMSRQQLGEEASAQAWQAGLRMTPTEAVDYALGQT